MPKKLPYLPLYTGDWRKDVQLSRCTPAARGVWIDLLCAMHDDDRSGELRGTADELAVLARCPASEIVQALTVLQTKGAADVERDRNGVFVVRNRRMCKEAEKRKRNAERQMRHRLSSRDGPVTPPITPLSESEIEDVFEAFWEVFPVGRKKSKGVARESYIRALSRATPEVINAAAAEYGRSEVGRGKWVKMPSTWLNQECWNDDREAWKNHDGDTAVTNGERIYKELPPDEFARLAKSGKFKGRPVRDKENAERWFGQLQDGSRVEAFFVKGK